MKAAKNRYRNRAAGPRTRDRGADGTSRDRDAFRLLPEGAPRQPKTRRGERTKAAILASAEAAFARDGYVAARIGDIADGAGVALGTFYVYFKNKDEVLAELLDGVFSAMYQSSRAPWLDEPPLDAIRGAVAGYLTAYHSHADMLRVMREALSVDPTFNAFWFAWRAKFLSRIVRNIQESQVRGIVPSTSSPLLAASALGGMLDDFCWIWLSMGGDEAVGQAKPTTLDLNEAIDLLSTLWYRALFCTEPLPALTAEPPSTVTLDGAIPLKHSVFR
jgi:AcrR family transcriptional regulator